MGTGIMAARVMIRVGGWGGTVIWHQGGLVGSSGPDGVASWDGAGRVYGLGLA
jgi:hypothetical protein